MSTVVVTPPRAGPLAFPRLVWIVLGGTLLTRTTFFMTFPFLAVILRRDLALSASQIGALLATGSLASSLGGLHVGYLSDRYGRRAVMTTGCATAVMAFTLLARAEAAFTYATAMLLAGLSRAAIEFPGQALIADRTSSTRQRQMAYHCRYFVINVAGALGPLTALMFGLSAQKVAFSATAAAYGAFGIVLAAGFGQAAPEAMTPHRERVTFRAVLGVLRSDRRFQLLVLAMFLSMAAYAQQESTLIQYLNANRADEAIGLVTALMVTNGLTIITFQFPLLRLLEGSRLVVRTGLGLAFFTAAFIAYAVLPVHVLLPWVIATWVLSVGEAVLFPTLQLQVDRSAPAALKGSYFGAAALSGLGFACGPLVGGLLLQYAGGPATFLITAASLGACGVCYWLAARHGE